MLLDILPQLLPYLHLTALLRLEQTATQVRAAIGTTDRFGRLEIHTADSTDIADDILFGEEVQQMLNCEDTSVGLLNRFAPICKTVFVFNQTDLEVVRARILEKMNVMIFLKISKFNFNLGTWRSDTLQTLCLGFDSMFCINSSADLRLVPLEFPNLKTLDLTGFPVSSDVMSDLASFGDCSPFLLWLMRLLGSTRQLQWLRLNCSVYEPRNRSGIEKEMLHGEIFEKKWKTNSIFFLEIGLKTVFAPALTEFLIVTSSETATLPCLHTLTLSARPTSSVLRTLSVSCRTLFHVVLNDFNLTADEWDAFGALLKKNAETLQVLVLRIPGKSDFHFDSFLHLILFHKVDQLDRFELQVVMDPDTGIMVAPYQTMTATATFRCRFKFNTFFQRSLFGIAMSERGPNVATSPMELFGCEMVSLMADELGGAKYEANLYTEWNALSKQQRGAYVEIFDEFVAAGEPTGYYCDLAATMATLRE